MANDFLLNLRAARGNNQNNIPKQLPTRGDIQKQRQADVDPNSFTNFLRIALGMQRVPMGKEQLEITDVPAHNMDKMSPEIEQESIDREGENAYNALNGTLNVDHDLNKYNASVNGTIDIPYGHSDFKNAYGVLSNYNELNKVLDEYDSINTWTGKQKFLVDAYKRFDDKYGDIGKWFDRLYGFTLEAKYYNEPETKNVTNVMRQLNDNIRKMLLRQY